MKKEASPKHFYLRNDESDLKGFRVNFETRSDTCQLAGLELFVRESLVFGTKSRLRELLMLSSPI